MNIATEDKKKKITEIDEKIEFLQTEKKLLINELYKLDKEKRDIRIFEIQERLDEVFHLLVASKTKFYKDIDEFNKVKEGVKLLESERENLLLELRTLEKFLK